ncbi:MAG: helix-turn-helix domain-containing protein [Oscillibacter sp.]|nr:helix-turn-helix domain-containing protein [Oscillibacter sp.]
MDNKLLGEQITRYRKEQNLTQEELGKAVGVSTQAVSRWENGGAPDVALLPAIADKLGVTIDALFGREGGERVDIHDTVARWMAGVPTKDRFDQLCRLNWTAMQNLIAGMGKFPEIGYLETCEQEDRESGRRSLMTSQAWLEGGFMLDVHAEDMSFASVWPKPEKGYDAYFAPRDMYRKLFAMLAKPGCLELLEYLHSQGFRLYVAETLAHILDLPLEDVQEILDGLCEVRIIRREELQLEDRISSAYYQYNGVELVPFLYIARCLMQTEGHMLNVGDGDKKPLLEGNEWKTEKEKKDEKK